MNEPYSADEWRAVWDLALSGRPVFASVFRRLYRSGVRLAAEEQADFVHEFLLERAPAALRSYQPERGKLAPWLASVFYRFVLAQRRDQLRRSVLLRRLEQADALADEPERVLDHARLAAALDQLPNESAAAIRAYFSSERPSIRAVADQLGISRWRSERLVFEAIRTIARGLATNER